jgi:hypothetical protein
MRRTALLLLPLVAVALAGCGLDELRQPYPDRRFYDLRADRPGPAAAPAANDARLAVRRFRMSPRFEGVELVTRRDAVTWESDFYHAFLVAPASILAEETRRWVAASGLFGQVLESGSLVESTHVLEGTGAALFADRSVSPARAVLEIHVVVIDVSDVPQPVFRRTYRSEVPVPDPAPPAFVRGWSAGLATVLDSLEKDLRELPVARKP